MGYASIPGVRCSGGQRVVPSPLLDGQVAWYWPSTGLYHGPGSDVFEDAVYAGELYPDLSDEPTLLLLLLELSVLVGLSSLGSRGVGVSWYPKFSSRSRTGGRMPEVVCWVLRVGDGAERRFPGFGTRDPLESLLLALSVSSGGAGSRTRVRVGSRA